MAYEIGYKRPLKSAQFKKGQSGNPNGRPRGSSNFLTVLEHELGQSIVVNENGKKRTVSRLQAMVKRLVAGALQGDKKSLIALVEILRRMDQFQPPDFDALLPDDHEALLEQYVARRLAGSSAATKPKSKGS